METSRLANRPGHPRTHDLDVLTLKPWLRVVRAGSGSRMTPTRRVNQTARRRGGEDDFSAVPAEGRRRIAELGRFRLWRPDPHAGASSVRDLGVRRALQVPPPETHSQGSLRISASAVVHGVPRRAYSGVPTRTNGDQKKGFARESSYPPARVIRLAAVSRFASRSASDFELPRERRR